MCVSYGVIRHEADLVLPICRMQDDMQDYWGAVMNVGALLRIGNLHRIALMNTLLSSSLLLYGLIIQVVGLSKPPCQWGLMKGPGSIQVSVVPHMHLCTICIR